MQGGRFPHRHSKDTLYVAFFSPLRERERERESHSRGPQRSRAFLERQSNEMPVTSDMPRTQPLTRGCNRAVPADRLRQTTVVLCAIFPVELHSAQFTIRFTIGSVTSRLQLTTCLQDHVNIVGLSGLILKPIPHFSLFSILSIHYTACNLSSAVKPDTTCLQKVLHTANL